MAFAHPEWLVDTDWLSEHLDDENLVVIDCPWDDSAYSRAHIPGAIKRPGHAYIKGVNEDGSNSLLVPGPEDLADLCQKMGIGPESDVIAYDDWGGLFATRLWWVLRYYGFDRTRVLDGGWQAWAASGRPVSFEVPEVPEVGRLDLVAVPARIVSADELIAIHADDDIQVLDVRSEEEHNGKADRGNARAGRIPGALHMEWNQLLENSTNSRSVRTLRSEDEVRALAAEAGLDADKTIVTHCQAAIRATYSAFVLEMMGFGPTRVYDGSAAEWANRDDTPLE
jgi:thiosulfate/3-mercaptopyruvate sulfurtransferase